MTATSVVNTRMLKLFDINGEKADTFLANYSNNIRYSIRFALKNYNSRIPYKYAIIKTSP